MGSLRIPASSNVNNGREVLQHEVGPRNANVFAEATLTLHVGGHMAALAHMRLLETGRPDQRLSSARALLELGPDALPALEALMAVAANDKDPEPAVRLEAITALGAIGRKAQAAEAELKRLEEHEDVQVAARAKAALRRIRSDK